MQLNPNHKVIPQLTNSENEIQNETFDFRFFTENGWPQTLGVEVAIECDSRKILGINFIENVPSRPLGRRRIGNSRGFVKKESNGKEPHEEFMTVEELYSRLTKCVAGFNNRLPSEIIAD